MYYSPYVSSYISSDPLVALLNPYINAYSVQSHLMDLGLRCLEGEGKENEGKERETKKKKRPLFIKKIN